MNGALRIIRVCRAITPNRTEPSIAPTRKGMNPCGFGISRRDNLPIEIVTFTGVDDRTDLSRLSELAKRYPKLEFGVLAGLP